MLLSGDTADCFEMAGDEFATAHEGFSIPKTSIGFGTRGLHETHQGLGYLGHMLGTTFDLFAAENPNLKGSDGEVGGVNDVMLKTLGRDQDPTKRARTRMDYIPDEKIMAMGKRAAANANTAEDASMEKQVREQYREMSTTSTNVQNALGPEAKQQLHETQTKYFELEEARKREAALAANFAKAPDDAALSEQLKALRADNQQKDGHGRGDREARDDPRQTPASYKTLRVIRRAHRDRAVRDVGGPTASARNTHGRGRTRRKPRGPSRSRRMASTCCSASRTAT